MADLHSASGPDDAGPDPEDDPGTPRWVNLFGIVAVALVLLFVALHPAGGGLRPLAVGDLRAVRVQLTVDAGAALLVLLVTTTLSVGKPRGLTARGRRALRANSRILSP